MKLTAFNYQLPKKLIAQKPCFPRDRSKLFVIDRKTKTFEHSRFFNLGKFLRKGDVIVLNNTKVIPARIYGKKIPSGGKVEILLIKKIKSDLWEVLVGAKRVKIGTKIKFSHRLNGSIIKHLDSIYHLRFNLKGKMLNKEINKIGQAPAPPYIKIKKSKSKSSQFKEWYQTVFAKKSGSVAAPTAGFHFTKKLMRKLIKQGINFEYITLHVGYGTFKPVKEKIIEKHKMYPEYVVIKKKVAQRLNQAKSQGHRIIACGTTSARALETATRNKKVKPFRGSTFLFIYPGYQFKFIDALITNFHLPQSTLLMLVAAFADLKLIKKAYQEAIKNKYRFYSFGDAMLIL